VGPTSVQPGDVQVNSLKITSPRGSLDLTKSFVTASVYESLMTPGIMASITVNDTDDQIGALKMVGDEMVEFDFGPPGGTIASYKFSLNKPETTKPQGAMKSKAYVLQCVSEEALHAKANIIQKSYKGKQISDIVKDIHKNYMKSSKKLEVEDTKGGQDILGQNDKPFAFADMVRRRAVSSDNKSSSYVFFENRDGFQFVTIEKLFKGEVIKEFKMENTVGHSINSVTDTNIIGYEVPKTFSASTRIASGGLGADTATFDYETNSYKVKQVKPDKMTTGGKGDWNSDAFKAKFGSSPGQRYIHPYDNRLAQTYVPETTHNQVAFAGKLEQNTIKLRVNGDTALQAGKLIKANIPNFVSTTGNNTGESQIEGNFLITRLRHFIAGAGEKPRYTCILECVKGDPEK